MIGIIGGSGFYSFLENVKEIEIETPYGKPSDKIAISKVEGKEVAFIPRHGKPIFTLLIKCHIGQIYMH